MNFLWYLLIGIVAGWLAGKISRGRGFGLWGDLVTGIIGSFIGGYLLSLVGVSTYGTIGSIISSTIGAVVLLWIIRMFTPSAEPDKRRK